MEVTSSQAAPSQPSGPASPSKNKGISSDFETFLKMLTVQMQNQDPLNPVDSSDYATQLATFSGVEQQVQTNDLLRAMAGQMAAGGLAQLSGWVGKDIRTDAPISFDGTPIDVVPDIATGAEAANLIVRDKGGAIVQTVPLPLDGQPVLWQGLDTNGARLPNGNYSFSTQSLVGGEAIANEPSGVYAKVAEVRIENGASVVVLANGQSIAVADVTALRETSS